MKRLWLGLVAVILIGVVLAIVSQAFGGAGRKARALESIKVPNTSSTAVPSHTVLDADHGYRLVVSGTISDWCSASATKASDCSNGSPLSIGQGVDAVYCYARWRCPTPQPWQQLNINGKGILDFAELTPADLPYSEKAGHTYTIEFGGVSGALRLGDADALSGSTSDNSGSFTVTLTDLGAGAAERLVITFAPSHSGIRGRIQMKTVGAKDANGGYRLVETYVSGSPVDLTVTRGIFGQHTLALAIVNGNYHPETGLSAEWVRLRVRVVHSTDSNCRVGAQGVVNGYVSRAYETRGTEINLCGESVNVKSEIVHIGVMKR